jgi:hypothetical protein
MVTPQTESRAKVGFFIFSGDNMTTISAPQLSISVPCLKCRQPVTVKASLTRAASKSGIFCPDCLPSKRQAKTPSAWTKDDYQDYLKTDHWQRFRLKALDHYGRKCYLCNATDCQIDLHHNTYERLEHELMSDVVPLCHTHHKMYEEWERGI